MKYEAFYLCDTCGHKWSTYYDRLKPLERGDVCTNCLDRPSIKRNFAGCITEPYFFKKLEEEA